MATGNRLLNSSHPSISTSHKLGKHKDWRSFSSSLSLAMICSNSSQHMNKTLSQVRCEDKRQLVKRPQLQMNKTLEADMSGGPLPYAFELSSRNSFTSLLPSPASPNSNTSSNDLQSLISTLVRLFKACRHFAGNRVRISPHPYTCISFNLCKKSFCDPWPRLDAALMLFKYNLGEVVCAVFEYPFPNTISYLSNLGKTKSLGMHSTLGILLRLLQPVTSNNLNSLSSPISSDATSHSTVDLSLRALPTVTRHHDTTVYNKLRREKKAFDAPFFVSLTGS
ncbi:hypothetical protein SADUNF_Sadunf16G0287800 [Salix dunnii]|uniref:Uncharacterized protein n=1 Tax=Salix dunnii TaxID=1413687 RepID=A0A835JEQ7_9ROSI|nr:hypothetical protein SADUNF_Sadunf16G0287800 [Salix dunnii]